MTKRRSLFITFEGIEGCGKSTQMKLLAQRLRANGYAVTENQEPGGTPIGMQIRRVLLNPENQGMAPLTELLLMFASRAQAAQDIVNPALERGEIVLSDRYTDSSLAYQGGGRGLGFDTVMAAHKLALGDVWPDLTIFLDVPVADGLHRARLRNAETTVADRLDDETMDFHRRVDEAYREIAHVYTGRVALVHGLGTPQEVAARIWPKVAILLAVC